MTEFNQTTAFCIPVKKEEWGVKEDVIMGGGAYGTVWQVCDETVNEGDCGYAMKMIPYKPGYREKKFNLEVKAINAFAKNGFTVPVIDSWSCDTDGDGGGVIITRLLDITASEFLAGDEYSTNDKIKMTNTLLDLFDDIHEKYQHGDSHLHNVMLLNVLDPYQSYTFTTDSREHYRVFVIDVEKSRPLKTRTKKIRLGRKMVEMTSTPEAQRKSDIKQIYNGLWVAPEVLEDEKLKSRFDAILD